MDSAVATQGHLTIADLEQVTDKVWDARVKWYQIGLGIKIKSTDLDAIRKRHGNDPDECFCELLSVWLKQASPKPTWALLTKALKSRLVGFEQLSEKLGSQSQIIECSGKSQQHESEIVNPKSDEEELSSGTNSDQDMPIEFNKSDMRQMSIDGPDKEEIPVEDFDPYKIDRSKRRPLKFHFGIVTPKAGDKVSNIGEYKMEKFPHGIALIINNELFAVKEKRTGTYVDEEHLIHAFRYLGYKVEVHRDVDSGKMMAIMENMAGRPEHADYDSFVCCILSHGSAGHVYGTDDKAVSIDELTNMFDAYNCPYLHNKPKLFFLQACRGPLTETAVSADGAEDFLPQRSEIPKTVDFFYGYATPLGYTAWRDHENGSWYISELCRTLCEMNLYASLSDIMAEVCHRLSRNKGYEHMGYRMIPEVTTRLEGNVFF